MIIFRPDLIKKDERRNENFGKGKKEQLGLFDVLFNSKRGGQRLATVQGVGLLAVSAIKSLFDKSRFGTPVVVHGRLGSHVASRFEGSSASASSNAFQESFSGVVGTSSHGGGGGGVDRSDFVRGVAYVQKTSVLIQEAPIDTPDEAQ